MNCLLTSLISTDLLFHCSPALFFRLDAEKIGMTGFEPATSWSPTRPSSQAELHPERGDSLGAFDSGVNEIRLSEKRSDILIDQAARCSLPRIRSKSSFDEKSITILPLSFDLPVNLISTFVPSQSRN